MTKQEIVRKNLDLLGEFMKYAFDNPEILNQIPPDAELVILPENNPELYSENSKMAQDRLRVGAKVVVFKLKTPKPTPPLLEKIAI